MSAGVFVTTRYQASYAAATYHKIRVQPETLLADVGGVVNDAPTQLLTNPISAIVKGSNRTLGLTPRKVRLKLPAGTTPPTGYKPEGTTTIPCLTTSFYDACVTGLTCTYLNVVWTILGTNPERAR